MALYCPLCAHEQQSTETCSACGLAPPLDPEDPKQREVLVTEDRRWRETRSRRYLSLSIAIAMAGVVALNFVPGYWQLRGVIGLPLFADQILLMAVVAGGLHTVFERMLARQHRFAFLAADDAPQTE